MTTRTAAFAVAFAVMGAVGAGASLAAPTPAFAQARNAAAEQFVQREAQDALRTLNDRSLTPAAKKQRFRRFVDTVADVPRITRFVLGKYARSVTPQQFAAFSAAFREVREHRL